MKPTLIVWWRYGKEHDPAGRTYRLNAPELIAGHLDEKIARARATPAAEWRWWQVDDDLLVERGDPHGHFGTDTRIYYLIRRGLTVIENIQLAPPDDRWSWFVHVADIFFDAARDCWIQQDLFADILVDHNGRDLRVMDLEDMATGMDLGLLSLPQASHVLRLTSAAADVIQAGDFPFPEVVRARLACRELGW